MRRHNKVWQQLLLGLLGLKGLRPARLAPLLGYSIRPQRCQEIDLRVPRRGRAAVRQIDNLTLVGPVDCGMRLFDEAPEAFRQPVISAGLPAISIHPLLDDHPLPIVGYDETMQVQVEPVLHRGTIDLRDEPAGSRQPAAVKPNPLADGDQLVRRLPRMLAARAANVNSEIGRERPEPSLLARRLRSWLCPTSASPFPS